jgi:hypothetical protein
MYNIFYLDHGKLAIGGNNVPAVLAIDAQQVREYEEGKACWLEQSTVPMLPRQSDGYTYCLPS